MTEAVALTHSAKGAFSYQLWLFQQSMWLTCELGHSWMCGRPVHDSEWGLPDRSLSAGTTPAPISPCGWSTWKLLACQSWDQHQQKNHKSTGAFWAAGRKTWHPEVTNNSTTWLSRWHIHTGIESNAQSTAVQPSLWAENVRLTCILSHWAIYVVRISALDILSKMLQQINMH